MGEGARAGVEDADEELGFLWMVQSTWRIVSVMGKLLFFCRSIVGASHVLGVYMWVVGVVFGYCFVPASLTHRSLVGFSFAFGASLPLAHQLLEMVGHVLL